MNIEGIFEIGLLIITIALFSYTFYCMGWRKGYDDGYDNAHQDFKTIFNDLKQRHK